MMQSMKDGVYATVEQINPERDTAKKTADATRQPAMQICHAVTLEKSRGAILARTAPEAMNANS